MASHQTLTEQLAKLITLWGAEWVMWLLVILSIVSVSVMVERAVFYLRRSVDASALATGLLEMLSSGDLDQAPSLLRFGKERGALPAIVAADLLARRDDGFGAMEQQLSLSMARERPAYDRGLSFLGTLGNNAPFIGLFGTVLGIIKAFADLAGNTQGGASVVMAGISEALVATAVGLLVALPAVVAFNMCRGRVKEAVSGAELVGRALLAEAHENNGGSEGSETAAEVSA